MRVNKIIQITLNVINYRILLSYFKYINYIFKVMKQKKKKNKNLFPLYLKKTKKTKTVKEIEKKMKIKKALTKLFLKLTINKIIKRKVLQLCYKNNSKCVKNKN